MGFTDGSTDRWYSWLYRCVVQVDGTDGITDGLIEGSRN